MSTKLSNFFDNPALSLHIRKQARALNERKNALNEWKILYFTAQILRYFTSIVAIYSAYNFFYSQLEPLFLNSKVCFIVSCFSLVIWQSICIVLIVKTFKFLLHVQLIRFLFILPFACGFYYIDYQASANGLGNRMAKKADNSDLLISSYNSKSDSLKSFFYPKIDSLQVANSTLSRVNTEFNYFQIKQNSNQIKQYYTILEGEQKSLKSNFEANYSNNKIVILSTFERYYLIIIIIQLIQLLSNFFIVLYYHLVDEELTKADSKLEATFEGIKNSLVSNIIQDITGQIKQLSLSLAYKFNNSFVFSENFEQELKQIPSSSKGTIGFKPSTTETQENQGLNHSLNSVQESKNISPEDREFLQKYLLVASSILNRTKTGLTVRDIYTKHNISKSTYYNVERILSNI